MKEPKVLFFDIETTPNLAFVWEPGKQYVNYDNLYKERKISCICYKWAGQKTVHSLTMDLSKHNINSYDDNADEKMLKKFSEIYAEADLVVGHNALRFDVAHIKARLVKYRLPDLTPVILDDTYLSSRHIGFNSHRLDYLGRYLGEGRKTSHNYSLWVRVMNGDRNALKSTVTYCKQDVKLLERLYDRLRPYIKSKLNRAAFSGTTGCCPSCGNNSLIGKGVRFTSSLGLRQRLLCMSCGKNFTTGNNLLRNAKEFAR